MPDIASSVVTMENNTPGTPVKIKDGRIKSENPTNGQVLVYNATTGKYENTSPETFRTINHEQLTNSSLGDINLLDGFVFPNAVQDYDGNWYDAVVVGNQVWLTENLKTTHYADGTTIPAATASTFSAETAYYYVYGSANYVAKYGRLYNWKAVMGSSPSSNANPSGVQGLAPDGWHIPSAAEFEQLITYARNQVRYSNKKCLATNQAGYWFDTADASNVVGRNLENNNATGFNIKANGSFYSGTMATSWKAPYCATFWSATENSEIPTSANLVRMNYIASQNWPEIINTGSKESYFGVRCISNLNPVQFRAWYVNTYGSMQHKLDELPSMSGNSGKVLAVNSDETGVEWVSQSGGTEEVLWCGWDDTNKTITNLTNAQIISAFSANKTIRCKYGSRVYTCVVASNSMILFSNVEAEMSSSLSPPSASVFNHKVNIIAYDSYTGLWVKSEKIIQEKLVSSTNIKTVNGNSLLGNGDIHISGDILIIDAIANANNTWKLPKTPDELISLYSSGVTVVVNVQGRLFYRGANDNPNFFSTNGSTNLMTLFYYSGTEDGLNTVWYKSTTNLQSQLTSGTNIKTINGNSLLGSGDLTIGGVTIYSGSTAPSPSTGSDGDIYIQTAS